MKKLIYTLPLILALGACTNEDVISPDNNTQGNPEGYYLTMSIGVPNTAVSTRSTTITEGASNNGVLDGTNNEEKISDLSLYFLDADATTTGHTTDNVLWQLTGIENASGVNNLTKEETAAAGKDATYKLDFKLGDTDLLGLWSLFGHKVKVVVVCNSSKASYTLANSSSAKGVTFDITAANATPIGDYLQTSGDDKQGAELLLTSADYSAVCTKFESVSTATSDADKKTAVRSVFETSGENMVLDLGSVDVERAVARLDFKDAAVTDGDDSAHPSAWTYKLGKSNVKIKLYSLTPFNINPKSYLFRHRASGTTSGDYYLASGDLTLFGNEGGTPYNWVADPSWGTSAYSKTAPTVNPLASASTGETKISDLEAKTGDVYNRTLQGGYFPWWYVSENSLLSTENMSEDNLKTYATGVAFKMQILAADGTTPLTSSNINTVRVPSDITKPSGSSNKLIITMPDTGDYLEVEPATDTERGYYLTYYGFITHNESKTADKFDPMYYGVVRNNVYQMQINTISHLPKKDGTRDYFLDLTINVLKWQRRLVDFEF